MDGILPLWKPKGMTSHDCVFKIRKMLKMKKVGHTGTLDPDVTGVLPICLGKATKVAEYITNAGKEYEGEVTLGYSTTTEDASGEKVDEVPICKTINRNQILDVLQSFRGEISQTPPMYSAVKVNGKRLYEYARKGIEVERPTRVVTIYEIELLDDRKVFSGNTISFRFRVKCSKGTYIRTLAVSIGEKLGFPAHMSDLTRTSSGSFTKENCLTFSDIETRLSENTLKDVIFPLDRGVSHLPKYVINDTLEEKVNNGAVLEKEEWWTFGEEEVVFIHQNQVKAIYKIHPEKPHLIKPVKVLNN
ncbi:tRNA pseudouridine(55) synthase TruB [Heyndrickxia sporothermodurans]|uniref:tRNA pseudouridine(55) synthase TruB n=1 Tax=Heyndrickxia sporothermodurans TaxID=46224 RepID=UPI000D3CD6D2|nr:tRNA pseudouridine(55) synthase TruB [Heyndrickxia sporothermodurans]MBL5793033.1 tRNA pseudouridine(55) synthase TruB [Heyndrickxia sporothermodurans]MBL5854071.1 tRNA pseudouridine(55) synthase TruB [Heyndrickxia sporothermodurans]PTY77716.1 tRNA pseudouridine(55) synthase TruB [Heyndrickxia sporothermodurans]